MSVKNLPVRILLRASCAGCAVFLTNLSAVVAGDVRTEVRYLSGRDSAAPVPWEFTVTGGRRAGERTTIPVPSQWEQHGFGDYDYGVAPGVKHDEHGLYRLKFTVPDEWKNRRVRLVFDGVMTDASVTLNGVPSGPVHQGAFYRFRHEVTHLLKFGTAAENILEVDVAKKSSNPDTDKGERGGDYWVFGGIFRPVWLEALPEQSILHAAIDARADGGLSADVELGDVRSADRLQAQVLDAAGNPVGAPFSTIIPPGGAGRVNVALHVENPLLWSAETPNLYSLRLTLCQGNEALHTITERFGFRTFEVRPGDGLYLNGRRILLKGVDRHSFRPETGRALSRKDCRDDAELIKAMNMNSVRMSHYPPDPEFLDDCDELGIYVLDELSGWHHAHDTEVGRRLVREMVERDVNHPSILFWDNGNEGGWNRALDGDFAMHDPQHRRVLHPWELHDDVDTKHYPPFADLTKRLAGPSIVMPTEFLHALYDGGGGAGLEDYWTAIESSPVGGGGFIWDLADEAVVRTDQGGSLDAFSTYAADGIVGPHHEKEGSYLTVRDVWCPVRITTPKLDGMSAVKLELENHYDFNSLEKCRFDWKLLRFPGPGAKETAPVVVTDGTAAAPVVPPHGHGVLELRLPDADRGADALSLTVFGPCGEELWTWCWPLPALTEHAAPPVPPAGGVAKLMKTGDEIRMTAGDVTAAFDAASGLLKSLRRGNLVSSLSHGPRLVFARPTGDVKWTLLSAADGVYQLPAPQSASVIEVELDYGKTDAWAGFKLEVSSDGKAWNTVYDGTRRKGDGSAYQIPPRIVAALRLSNIRRQDGGPIGVKSVRVGHAAERFPAEDAGAAVVTTGEHANAAWLESSSAAGLEHVRWTLRGDGSLELEYRYALDGAFLYHGITFDHPEENVKSLRWLGEGPYRVWQNRLRGTRLGVHEIQANRNQPGEAWAYPEFQGCFAGLRWARLDDGDKGRLDVYCATPETFLRVGTPPVSHPNTTVEFPAGDVSFLHAIPAMGSKFLKPENSGPSGKPAQASGVYSGRLVFSLESRR